jgi:hypothetical protein
MHKTWALQAAEKRAEATSEAQEDILPESEHPKELMVRSPQTSFSVACKAPESFDPTYGTA